MPKLTQAELTELAIDQGAKLDLPPGVRHMLILIDGDRYEPGGAGVAYAKDIENPGAMLQAGADVFRKAGLE